MKNLWKRIGAILVTLLVLVGLAGCGGKTPVQNSSVHQSSVVESSLEAESSSESSIESSSAISQAESSKAESSKAESSKAESSKAESSKAESSKAESSQSAVVEDGKYYSKDDVALYIHLFGHLPSNYLTKNEAKDLGWVSNKGNLWKVTDKMVIGGDRFGNNEGLLPKKKNRTYTECDVNYQGGMRDAQRIVFSNDGLIYFTEDHYQTFELLYGEE